MIFQGCFEQGLNLNLSDFYEDLRESAFQIYFIPVPHGVGRV